MKTEDNMLFIKLFRVPTKEIKEELYKRSMGEAPSYEFEDITTLDLALYLSFIRCPD